MEPVLGYTFAIELKTPMYERNTVVELAEKIPFLYKRKVSPNLQKKELIQKCNENPNEERE